ALSAAVLFELHFERVRALGEGHRTGHGVRTVVAAVVHDLRAVDEQQAAVIRGQRKGVRSIRRDGDAGGDVGAKAALAERVPVEVVLTGAEGNIIGGEGANQVGVGRAATLTVVEAAVNVDCDPVERKGIVGPGAAQVQGAAVDGDGI